MTLVSTPALGLIDTNHMPFYKDITHPRSQLQGKKLSSSQHHRFRRILLCQEMDYMATLLGKPPHTPRRIATFNLPSQKMNDVVAVLYDPFFFVSDAQHELSKRQLETSGCQDDLLCRLFEALERELAEGWTFGYLLNTKTLPFNGKGRDPRSLVGHHVEGYKCDGDGILIMELCDGEDAAILSIRASDGYAKIKMDDDLFWALHSLDGMKAVPRDLVKKPLLITEAVIGVRKNRWGKEAGTVFGLKLEGMRAISFLFLAGKASAREDRIHGDLWLAENDVLREDISMLRGGDETMVEEVRKTGVMAIEHRGLQEDMRGLHGFRD
ncbi:hypothetical protein HO133_010827 [Letharia lupina]|uniref:Uncharacterized protein n=1 Tax=Letharia lupina TaxID=560253 RepID=A0A8H6CIS0_9LECA|nr:uncharacterized protein HO133_003200 [Letharia lupina]XP_037153312.1 uncharacterized protein HO133_010827 [Letharia lupina]KAF6220069.1 hypothetical protein HO133_003200 [Letharia lupina]KAF6224252.1 hypothetical protein HO133_010827 [Letharia lupina]